MWCLINDVLCDFLGRFVIAYINDILINSTSKETHIHHVKKVLDKLRENQLYVNGEKCVFHVETMVFLGFIISANRIKMDCDKLRDCAAPKTVKELQHFLGLANFYW